MAVPTNQDWLEEQQARHRAEIQERLDEYTSLIQGSSITSSIERTAIDERIATLRAELDTTTPTVSDREIALRATHGIRQEAKPLDPQAVAAQNRHEAVQSYGPTAGNIIADIQEAAVVRRRATQQPTQSAAPTASTAQGPSQQNTSIARGSIPLERAQAAEADLLKTAPDVYGQLKAQGALSSQRLSQGNQPAAQPKAQGQPAIPQATQAQLPDDLGELTVTQLKKLAGELEIPGRSKLTRKAPLVESINNVMGRTVNQERFEPAVFQAGGFGLPRGEALSILEERGITWKSTGEQAVQAMQAEMQQRFGTMPTHPVDEEGKNITPWQWASRSEASRVRERTGLRAVPKPEEGQRERAPRKGEIAREQLAPGNWPAGYMVRARGSQTAYNIEAMESAGYWLRDKQGNYMMPSSISAAKTLKRNQLNLAYEGMGAYRTGPGASLAGEVTTTPTGRSRQMREGEREWERVSARSEAGIRRAPGDVRVPLDKTLPYKMGESAEVAERGISLRAAVPLVDIFPSGQSVLKPGVISGLTQPWSKDIKLPSDFEPTEIPGEGATFRRGEPLVPFKGGTPVDIGDWESASIFSHSIMDTEEGRILRLTGERVMDPARGSAELKTMFSKSILSQARSPEAFEEMVGGRQDIEAVTSLKEIMGAGAATMMNLPVEEQARILGVTPEEVQAGSWQEFGPQLLEHFRQNMPGMVEDIQYQLSYSKEEYEAIPEETRKQWIASAEEREGVYNITTAPIPTLIPEHGMFTQIKRGYEGTRRRIAPQELERIQRTDPQLYEQVMEEAQPMQEAYGGLIRASWLSKIGAEAPTGTRELTPSVAGAMLSAAHEKALALTPEAEGDISNVPRPIMQRQILEQLQSEMGGKMVQMGKGQFMMDPNAMAMLGSVEGALEGEESGAIARAAARVVEAAVGREENPEEFERQAGIYLKAQAASGESPGTWDMARSAIVQQSMREGTIHPDTILRPNEMVKPVQDVLRMRGLKPGSEEAKEFEARWRAGEETPTVLSGGQPSPGGDIPLAMRYGLVHPETYAERGGLLDPQTATIMSPTQAQAAQRDFDADRMIALMTGSATPSSPEEIMALARRAPSWGAGSLPAEILTSALKPQEGESLVEAAQRTLDPENMERVSPEQLQERFASAASLYERIGSLYNTVMPMEVMAREGGASEEQLAAISKFSGIAYGIAQRPEPLEKYSKPLAKTVRFMQTGLPSSGGGVDYEGRGFYFGNKQFLGAMQASAEQFMKMAEPGTGLDPLNPEGRLFEHREIAAQFAPMGTSGEEIGRLAEILQKREAAPELSDERKALTRQFFEQSGLENVQSALETPFGAGFMPHMYQRHKEFLARGEPGADADEQTKHRWKAAQRLERGLTKRMPEFKERLEAGAQREQAHLAARSKYLPMEQRMAGLAQEDPGLLRQWFKGRDPMPQPAQADIPEPQVEAAQPTQREGLFEIPGLGTVTAWASPAQRPTSAETVEAQPTAPVAQLAARPQARQESRPTPSGAQIRAAKRLPTAKERLSALNDLAFGQRQGDPGEADLDTDFESMLTGGGGTGGGGTTGAATAAMAEPEEPQDQAQKYQQQDTLRSFGPPIGLGQFREAVKGVQMGLPVFQSQIVPRIQAGQPLTRRQEQMMTQLARYRGTVYGAVKQGGWEKTEAGETLRDIAEAWTDIDNPDPEAKAFRDVGYERETANLHKFEKTFEPGEEGRELGRLSESLKYFGSGLEDATKKVRDYTKAVEDGTKLTKDQQQEMRVAQMRARETIGAARGLERIQGELTPEQEEQRQQALDLQQALKIQGAAAAELPIGGDERQTGGIGGIAKNLMSGWGMMQLQRRWNMTGGAAMKAIPQAAEAEQATLQAAMAGLPTAAYEPGQMGMGIMRAQAQQRNFQIAMGRGAAGAWGWTQGALGEAAGTAAGVLGPAAGIGLTTGLMATWGLGAAAGGPIGIGAGLIAAGVGGISYAREAASDESRMAIAAAGGGTRLEGFLQPLATPLEGRVAQSPIAKFVQRITSPILPQVEATGGELLQRGQQILAGDLTGLNLADRQASIQEAIRKAPGELAFMDETQLAQGIEQWMTYHPQDTNPQAILNNPEFAQIALRGDVGKQFEAATQLGQAFGIGPVAGQARIRAITDRLPNAAARMKYYADAELMAPLSRYGIGPEEVEQMDIPEESILRKVSAGERAQVGAEFQRYGGTGTLQDFMLSGTAAEMLQRGETIGQFRQLSKAYGLGGWEQAQELTAGLAPDVAAQRQENLGIFAPLGRLGVTPQMVAQITGARGQYAAPELSQQQEMFINALGSGQGWAWSDLGRQSGNRAWQTEQGGFTIGTNWGGDILRSHLGQVGWSGQQVIAGLQQRGGGIPLGALRGEGGAIPADVSLPNAGQVMIGGEAVDFDQWSIQDKGLRAQQEYQQWQYGYQRRGLELGAQYTRASWGLQDQMTGLQRGWQESGLQHQEASTMMSLAQTLEKLAKQEEQTKTQYQWAEKDIRTGYERQQVQFGWAHEDLAFRGQQTQLQFGWQMEDLAEAEKFATGRDRQRIRRQQERASITFGMSMGRLDTEEERLKTKEEWAEEDFGKEMDRHQQRQEWAMKDIEMARRHAQERAGLAMERIQATRDYYAEVQSLEDEQKELQRDHWEEEHKLQREALEKQHEYQEIQNQIANRQIALGRAMETQINDFKNEFQHGGTLVNAMDDFVNAVVESVNTAISRLPFQ